MSAFAPTQDQVAAWAGISAAVYRMERLALQVDSVRVNPVTWERLGSPHLLRGLRVKPDGEVPTATFVICLAPEGLPEMLDGDPR